MEDQKIINEFVTECRDIILERNIKDDEYCIIVYVGRFREKGDVFKIYKSIDIFKDKVAADLTDVDSSRSINFEVWLFD